MIPIASRCLDYSSGAPVPRGSGTSRRGRDARTQAIANQTTIDDGDFASFLMKIPTNYSIYVSLRRFHWDNEL